MSVARNEPLADKFNVEAVLPFNLRIDDFRLAMQDAYDFFFDVNSNLVRRDLPRLDDMMRSANLSGMISDMLTANLARHSRSLAVNGHHNGHPDLLVRGKYPADAVKSGDHGVEVKTTVKPGGAVDTHGARNQWMCVFVYEIDTRREVAVAERVPLTFREVYLGEVTTDDFRRNARGELGTRTATLDAQGIAKLRRGWIYLDRASSTFSAARRGMAPRASSK